MTPDPKTYDLNVLARAYHLELLRANHELAPGDTAKLAFDHAQAFVAELEKRVSPPTPQR
jgi:hypothetical protein